jgi:transcriptional regulator GlxA family with amidase domain
VQRDRFLNWIAELFMTKKFVVWSGLTLLALAAAGLGAWILSLPPTPAVVAAPPIPEPETDAALAALRPTKRARPLIAIVGLNDSTETTDYLMPYGILRRADVADVVMLATSPGPVTLYPALQVEADATVAQFDAQHAEGADYVIVPAMSRDDDPAVLAWLKNQADRGAIIVGICAGAKVVGAAGLLDGKRATTHWFFIKEMLQSNPQIDYVADRRIVVDRGVATTTGISASMPMMLTLIEAIAGREKAQATARELGLKHWNARHASSAFMLTRPFATTVLGNVLAFWNREQLGIALESDIDEVSLALVADAWSRTYRSRAVTFAASSGAVRTRNGMRVIPDQVAANWPSGHHVPTDLRRQPAEALNQALDDIAARFGDGTANVVAMQLEYPQDVSE